MMVRLLYIWLLRLYPRAFRRRFAEEMLWIFDQTATREKTPLLVDALISLVRQRVLRPAIEEPLTLELAPASCDGVPLFYTFESFKPRTSALINGAILSVAVFAIGFFVFDYGLHEPLRSHFAGAQPGGRSSTLPSWGNESGATFGEPGSLQSEESEEKDASEVWPRLRSLFAPKSSPHSDRQARTQENQGHQPNDETTARKAETPAKTSPTSQEQMTVAHATPSPPHDRTAHAGPEARPSVSHAVPDHPMEVSAKVLQSYVGRYFADSPTKLKISISVEEGQLNLKIAGQPKSALLPISETRFSFAGGSDSWIEFSKNTDGTVNELEIFQGESHITAHRVNRPLIQCHRVK